MTKPFNGTRPAEAPPAHNGAALSRGRGPATVEDPRGHPGLERSALTRRTGLLLPSHLSLGAWQRIGRQIHVISDSSAWWWGDWLVFGEERYPDRYRRAISETSLDYQTLRNYAWVARRFAMSRRRDRLSFQHHVVVTALPDDEQDHWLCLAEEHGWSRNELRRRLRDDTGGAGTGPDPEVVFELKVGRDRQDRWQAASVRANEELVNWMVLSLDRAADTLLQRVSGPDA